MSGNKAGRRAWGRRGRFMTGLNVAASLVLAAAAVVMLNYLSMAHFHSRRDITQSRFYVLSENTRKLMAGISGEIRVFVVWRGAEGDEGLYRDIRNLLEEYRQFAGTLRSLRFEVEVVDPDRDLARIEALQQKYDIRESNVVVVDCGGRTKVVPERLLVEYDLVTTFSSITAEKRLFLGEQAISSAILAVTEERQPVAYFVRGHGEREVSDFGKYAGLSSFARCMSLDNIEVRSISLSEQQGIPEDCDLLILAGQKTALHAAEVEAVRGYLDAGRNLLLMADCGRPTGLEDLLLREWGVKLGPEKVCERTIPLRISGGKVVSLLGSGEELYVRKYGLHPITAGLRDLETVMWLPSTVSPTDAPKAPGSTPADRPTVTMLGYGSENAWAETDLQQDPATFDEGIDRKGPVPVAVAVERGRKDAIGVGLRLTHIVVIGDSDFVTNERLYSGGNRDFAMGCVNWLLEREKLIAVGSKPYGSQKFQMDAAQVRRSFIGVVLVPPGLVALLGLTVWLRRVR